LLVLMLMMVPVLVLVFVLVLVLVPNVILRLPAAMTSPFEIATFKGVVTVTGAWLATSYAYMVPFPFPSLSTPLSYCYLSTD
jgi:hypothetical protein